MKNFINALAQMFKDKTGAYSLRELVTLMVFFCLIAMWIGDQFFNFEAAEYMFWGFLSLVAAGFFGYTFDMNPMKFFTKTSSSPQVPDSAQNNNL